MRRGARIFLCMLLAVSLVYTPAMIPQFARIQTVAVAEAATIKLNKKKTTVAVGDTVQLKMSGTSKKIKWTSSKKKVATVTAKGVVKGKKAGTAVIRAKVGGKTYKCTVTVKKMPYISAKTKTVYLKGTENLKMKALSKSAAKTVTWSSNNKKVATVSRKGVVTGKKAGTATITAKVGKKTYKCKVTVKKRITAAKKSVTIAKVDSTASVKITNIGKGKVSSSSSDRSVATTKWSKKWNGTKNTLIITAKSPGTATISLKNSFSKEVLKIKVTVPQQAVYGISYELNGGTNAADNPATYTYGKSLKLAAPSRDNYEFKGWYLDKAFTQKVESIAAGTEGDITLYAKWHQAALQINDTGMDDMIWSWWYYPQVVSDGDKVFWGYATKEGYCGVAAYDRATGTTNKTILKKAKADDHNGLALTLLKDKRIMAVYSGGHDENKEVHVRISANPLDIGTFDQHIVLESAHVTSYGQIVESQGKYYLFYRAGNRNWAYRYSTDGINWSEENIFLKANTQYYCKVMPTTEDGLLRIVMYSNPAGTDMNIRMAFLKTADNTLYNADMTTKVADTGNPQTVFTVLQPAPTGENQVQRLFDVAITEPSKPRFLYAVFNKKAKSNESTYYLYDAGKSVKICDGGKPLWDPKYQLGASFVGPDTIAAGRNAASTDYIELYHYDGTAVTKTKTVDTQIGIANGRNARPIVDVNGKAILWHNGYYNLNSYQDYDTSARMYLLDSGQVIGRPASAETVDAMARVKPENVAKARAYADKLYEENKGKDQVNDQFTWERITRESNWIYYTGLVHKGLLALDSEKYTAGIQPFYTQHIKDDGSIQNYHPGALDSAQLAANFLTLLAGDTLTTEERTQYQKAVNYVYNQLEKQTVFEDAGMLMMHAQNSKGEPVAGWTKWSICLDGIYMSQLFLIRTAEAIDQGTVNVTAADGHVVTSSEIWSDVYKRMIFVMQKMKDAKTGMPYHGYDPNAKETNKAFWSRGIGWYAMVLLEAAEKMPNAEKKEILTKYYTNLMNAVLEWQDPETFLWYNVTDRKEDVGCTKDGVWIGNKPESSGSAMFAYCLLRGYHDGLLKGEEYRSAGLRAFNSLVETKLTEDGLIDIYSSSSVTSNPNLYQINGYTINEGKGVGPLILATKYAY